MAKIVLDPITSGYNLTKLNENFQAIADELNDKVLYRDNPEGEDNSLQTDTDFNSKRLLNLPTPVSASEPIRFQEWQETIGTAETAVEDAQAAQAAAEAAQAEVEALLLSRGEIRNTGDYVPGGFNYLTSDIFLSSAGYWYIVLEAFISTDEVTDLASDSVQVWQGLEASDLGGYTDYVFANVEDMKTGTPIGGASGGVVFTVGQQLSTGGTTWRTTATETGIDLGGSIYAESVTKTYAKDFFDGVLSDTEAFQGFLDSLRSGAQCSLAGLGTIVVDKPLHLMSDLSWRDGFTSADRENILIDGAGSTIQFADTVTWSQIWDDTPIEIRGQEDASTFVRQPTLVIVSLDAFTMFNITLDGNMQARGAAQGIPPASEQEHCLKLIACKNPNVYDITTQDSMGDGILVGYPYTTGSGGDSAFFGADSVGGVCEDVTVFNHKAYRHARLGVSVVGCNRANFSNLYGEDIDNVTDYKSGNGPGAVIDVEYDTSNSFYNSLGFSFAENIVIHNVHGVNCPVGGAVQVQNGRHIQISKVRAEGDSAWGVGRIEGDPTTVDGAKHVTLDGALITNDGSSNYIGRFGGENTVVKNLSVGNGSSFANGITIPDASKGLVIDGVKGADLTFTDTTGNILDFEDGADAVIQNLDITVSDSSAGMRNPIRFEGAAEAEFHNIRITASDSVTISALGRGAFHCEGTGANITGSNLEFNFKSATLISQASENDVNTIDIQGGYLRGCILFPASSAMSGVAVEDFEVQSCYNDASSSPAMLNLYLKSDQTIKLKNIESNSNGEFGFNKTIQGGRVETTSATFASLTNVSVLVDGLNHSGGRESDGSYFISAYANGVLTSEPWTDTTPRDFFTFKNVKINGSTAGRTTLTSGSTVYSVNLNTVGNFSLYPNAYAVLQPISSGIGANNFFTEFANQGGFSSPAFMRLTFSANLASDTEMLIITL